MTPTTPTIKKPRPYWHVDAKWISGIFLLILLSITAMVFLLWQITSRNTGTSLLTTLLASSFSYHNGGLDDEGDIKMIRAMIANAPNKQWQPSAGLDVIVHEADIEGMTPRQVRMWYFGHIAKPLYEGGVQNLSGLITDETMQNAVEETAMPLGFISAEMHARLLWVLAGCTLLTLLFLGLQIRFSAGVGCLANPGAVMLMAGAPGWLFWELLRGWLDLRAQNLSPDGGQDAIQAYTQLAVDVMPVIVQKAVQIYTYLVLFGLVLLLAALVGAFFMRRRKVELDNPEQE
jgi:hypothetical protein